MAAFIALFTGLCGFKKETRPRENQSSPLETIERETSNDLQNKEINDLQKKETVDRDTDESDDDNNVANPELPLPPSRKTALRGTYSCNNMVLKKSGSTKKKLSASLTIQMPRASSVAKKHDGKEDTSVRKRRLKAENSILVRPIILGEKCRVLDVEEEGDEDHSQRMPKNRIYHPRSLSSISISRTNSKIDINVIPVKETSENSVKEKKNYY